MSKKTTLITTEILNTGVQVIYKKGTKSVLAVIERALITYDSASPLAETVLYTVATARGLDHVPASQILQSGTKIILS